MENLQRSFKVETIKGPADSEVSFSPERGGIITSIKLQGTEILYMDQGTFQDENKTVKGGIPILFPNSGPLDSEEFPNLKQHGFARNSSKWKSEKIPNGFRESLNYNEESLKVFPYKFRLSLKAEFQKDGSITIFQEVENLEEDKELPISMGLHPYFKVPKEEKKNIKFNFEGGKFIEERVNFWSNDDTVSVDNPKLKDPSAVMEIVIPELGTLFMDASSNYRKILAWSLLGKDFFCPEPVMRDDGGLVDDPEMVKAGETFSASMNLRLKKE